MAAMSFTELPLELQTDVLSELDDASLEVAACVCRAFHRVAPAIWRRRLGTRFATSRWAHVGSEGTSARTMLRKMQALQHTEWDSMRAAGSPPADRGGHASTMLGQGQWIVIHGGANGDVLHGDGFALSCAGQEWTWHRLRDERAPCPRWAHTAAPWGSIALFFGGHAGGFGALNDVRALDAANSAEPCDWAWRAAEEIECSGAAPEPRYGHAMCEHADAIWVFGGIVGEVRFATWRLTHPQSPPSPPRPHAGRHGVSALTWRARAVAGAVGPIAVCVRPSHGQPLARLAAAPHHRPLMGAAESTGCGADRAVWPLACVRLGRDLVVWRA